eukprot:tig00000581_g2214.t1
MPEIDSLPAVEGCESLVPLCTDWLDNVAYNMHTRRVNNRMHVDGIQCTDWLRDGIPSSDQRQIHARTILYCPALQMLTTYLEPKGPGVCWARVRNAIDAEGDSEEARAHRFPKPHDNMYPVFTQASNYRTAVFTEDAHMPRRRDLSFANETCADCHPHVVGRQENGTLVARPIPSAHRRDAPNDGLRTAHSALIAALESLPTSHPVRDPTREMEFFVIARDISGHAKNGRFPIPPALDVNPGIPCADGTHAHHSHPHWHLLATRPLINPKGHSEHKRLNAAVTRIIADTATEDDVTTLRTWIAIARETTTIAAINTNISNTNEQLRRPYRGAEGEQLLHLVEMAAMAITNTGAPPPRTRQAAANHVTSVLRKELEAFDVDTTVQAIVNALCARRVFTFTDGAMDTTDAPPAPTTTLTLPGAAVVESLLNRVKTSFTDAQNRSPTFMRPNRRTAAVNYVESTLRTYLRGYDVESTILLLVYILEREGELRFASGPDATSAKAADAYARFVAANAPTDPVAGPSSVATAEGLAPEDKTPIAAGRYEREGGDRVFASRTVEKIMVSVGGQQILLFLSPVDMPAPCHTCSIGPDGSPVIVNHRLRASVISIAHRYYEYIDSTTGNTVTMTNVELQEHCRLCTTPPYMEFLLADEQLARELQARLDAEAAKGEDPTPGNPHYHDDDMTCPTAPVTPPTDAPEPPAPRNDPPPAPEVTASSTDTPDAQPVAPATTTPDAQPVAPVTTTPVTPTPALETPVSSTAARDASPIAPAMATSLTTPHSVPSPTAVAAVSTAPSPAPELLAPSDAPPARPRL